jgi:hypothetical protein
MRLQKDLLLTYGLEKGYYTPEEQNWCLQGKNIKDYQKSQKVIDIDNVSVCYDGIVVPKKNLINHTYPNACANITSGLVDIAKESQISIPKVCETYNQFNKRTYKNFFNNGEKFSTYIPELEEKALELTKRYFNIQKIRDLRDSKN